MRGICGRKSGAKRTNKKYRGEKAENPGKKYVPSPLLLPHVLDKHSEQCLKNKSLFTPANVYCLSDNMNLF